MLVASRTDEEYFGIKVLLEFGQAVNTTVSKYIWKKKSKYHKPYAVWNRVYTYHHSFLGFVFPDIINCQRTNICTLSTISALSLFVSSNLLATVIKYSVGYCNNGKGGITGSDLKNKNKTAFCSKMNYYQFFHLLPQLKRFISNNFSWICFCLMPLSKIISSHLNCHLNKQSFALF